jgi:hypothetical protein
MCRTFSPVLAHVSLRCCCGSQILLIGSKILLMQPPQLSLLSADTRNQVRRVSRGPHFATFQES